MYAVIRYSKSGQEVARFEHQTVSRATKVYARWLARHKGQHIRVVQTGELPGMPAKVIGEHFGRERS